MDTLTLNGRDHRIRPGTTVIELVAEATGRALNDDGTPLDGERLGIAVAVDARVVPRSLWRSTRLAEGHSVEIITAMQGG